MTSKQLVTTEPQEGGPLVTWWNPLHWPAGIWLMLIGLGLTTTPFVIRAIMLAGIPEMPEPFDEVAYSNCDIASADNAFTYYREALALHDKLLTDLVTRGLSDVEPEDPMLILKEGWPIATESTRRWLELHREPLAIWRRGTERDQGLNLLPSKLTIKTTEDVPQAQRMFVRLAIREEARLIASGDLDEARKWARAAFRNGGHTTHRGCILQGFIGIAIHETSSQGLAAWAEQPSVTSEQLRQALIEARSDDKLYDSLSNNLKSEYLLMRNSLRVSDWTPISRQSIRLASEAKCQTRS